MFFYFLLWRPFYSAERNDFSNFGRGSTKEHFSEIILKIVHWSRRRCHLKVFFLFLSLVAILFRATHHFRNFGRRSSKENFYEIILKSVHWSRRGCHLEVFHFFSSGRLFLQWSGIFLAILVGTFL